VSVNPLHTQHERQFERNRFVYPVLSRRSGGISVGINLNPDKVCNFDCVYCQVNRVSQRETRFVETTQLLRELDATLDLAVSGRLFETGKFSATPDSLRHLADIAFSGDGEPTTHRNFDEIVAQCAEVKRARGLDRLPLVLITNASMFHRDHVRRALEVLRANQGEIWAKLDAGTAEYYQRVNRSPFRFEQILDNITAAAVTQPLVIQSLFMRLDGQGPPESERSEYCRRLREIAGSGGQIKLVQIYTIARMPAESFVTPLADAEVDELVDYVRRHTSLNVTGFHGIDPSPPAVAASEEV
jgi:wyosine [tRNA(Phe)-imidazoG37] synthetase (radical SAM superfamily)